MQGNKDNEQQKAQADNTRNTQQQPITNDRSSENKETPKQDGRHEDYTEVLESGLGIDE